MTVIDLTDPSYVPRVAMITRFPPSESGSAMAALDLSRQLHRNRRFDVEVIRLLVPGEAAAVGHPVVMEMNTRWHLCPALAARRANRCDVAVVRMDRHVPIQVVDELLEDLEIPVILTIDDVGPVDSDETEYLADAARRAGVAVVPSNTARNRLMAHVDDATEIEVIPHGSPWRAIDADDRARRQILTWGYVAPGMGAERVIRSLALLQDLEPPPRYRLIGVADPVWSSRESAAYRASLTGEAESLGVGALLDLVPVAHSRRDLEREIVRSDMTAVVYDSRDRAASRILTEAVSTGRPVVATAFPGAVELLSSGAGLTVDHDDLDGMAAAFRRYMTDSDEYLRASKKASVLSGDLSLEKTAAKYARLLEKRMGSGRLTVNKA